MKKKLFLFVSLILFTNAYFSYADEIEQKFKTIGEAIKEEFYKTVKPIGSQYEISDEEREDNYLHQIKLFKEWQKELKKLVETKPNSIWADDAQYLMATLNIKDNNSDIKQRSSELEYLIEKYPSIHIEQWTKDNIVLVRIPKKISDDVWVRCELIFEYQQIGDNKKAEALYRKSRDEFPDYADLLARFYDSKDISKAEVEKLRRKYFE